MEKNVEIGLLCDIYGDLLTEKQQDILDLYYNNNLSLAEVAEELGITRQAVKDSIVKGERKLFRIRRKTWYYEKDAKTRKANTKDIIRVIKNPGKTNRWWNSKYSRKSCMRIKMHKLNSGGNKWLLKVYRQDYKK